LKELRKITKASRTSFVTWRAVACDDVKRKTPQAICRTELVSEVYNIRDRNILQSKMVPERLIPDVPVSHNFSVPTKI
jgi:hypothetical protein